ncbi:hypothetical protein [Methanosarcina acetivorans]|uniref:Transmembrane protein n=1 Tax=Methanosarcina acetivorans (strain ATCC 35395 / DSM 2834 / JCM 12185 / C2A) TaxID=188937 RepID=Q8TL18_METAC|nr:hypothetical protein [Methanosarcina acetivorans]AAM06596.1 predicted protein [Methanosarcina acetivorans C2A]
MDITFFIFLSLIALFLMFYGWQMNGVNFIFLILSSAIFLVLALSSSEITWTYVVISNSTAIDYTVTQRSIVFARLYGLLSGLCFLMALAKLAILAEENTKIDFSKIWEKITKGKV